MHICITINTLNTINLPTVDNDQLNIRLIIIRKLNEPLDLQL